MPKHDVVDDVARYIRRESQEAKESGFAEVLWTKPHHYMASLALFPRHFMEGMEQAEVEQAMMLMVYYNEQIAKLRGQ